MAFDVQSPDSVPRLKALLRGLLRRLCVSAESVVCQTIMKVEDIPGPRNKFLVGMISVLKQQLLWLKHVKLDQHVDKCHPEFLPKLQIIEDLMERARNRTESLDEFDAAIGTSGLRIAPPDPKAVANSGYVYCYLLKVTEAGFQKIAALIKDDRALKSVASKTRQSTDSVRNMLISLTSAGAAAKVGESMRPRRSTLQCYKQARFTHGARVPYGGDPLLRTVSAALQGHPDEGPTWRVTLVPFQAVPEPIHDDYALHDEYEEGVSNAIAAGSLRLVFEALPMLSMGQPFDVEHASHPSSGIANQEIGIAHSSQCMPRHADQTDEQKEAHADATRKGLANMTDEQNATHWAALSVAPSEVWANMSDQQRANRADAMPTESRLG